jgi:penicillin-binding protein 2
MASRRTSKNTEIDPDEIFLDAVNLPKFNDQQFEGRLERPIGKRALFLVGITCALVFTLFFLKAGSLQILQGPAYAARSISNTLRQIPVFGERGKILDRNGEVLASNDSSRVYAKMPGLAHILGYVGYPTDKDLKNTNDLSTKEYVGKAGAEQIFNDDLRGVPGTKIVEVDARGNVDSENIYQPPLPGASVTLSIDSRIQSQMYKYIEEVAKNHSFTGGAGLIMDLRNGEIIAMTSYPEYDANILSDGADKSYISTIINDNQNKPFLNRALSGIYTPGSVVKPIMAIAALNEHVITPEKEILSTGQIAIQNPYDKTKQTVFKDWKAHGLVDVRHAIAFSSDVYFYEVGGGYKDQPGLGILNIEKYLRMFGFGEKTGIELSGEGIGTIPSPEWKAANFDGEPWYLGNTYHTAIGQYGVGVTPLQMIRGIAAVANGGILLKPTILKSDEKISAGALPSGATKINLDPSLFQIAREGMRLSATIGTGSGLNTPAVSVASKTGTAELGVSKANVNSWVEGFYPYENPHYAFMIVMEHGPVTNTIGGVYVMRQLLDWMSIYTPEMLK